MARRENTLSDDLDTLREAIDVLIEYGAGFKRERNWRYIPRHPQNGPQFRERTSGPQRLPHTVTDPLFVADWALQRVIDALAFRARQDLKELAQTALDRAETEARNIVKEARKDAKGIRQKAEVEGKRLAAEAENRARAAHANLEKEVEKRVTERIQQMYSATRRTRPLALTRRIEFVDED